MPRKKRSSSPFDLFDDDFDDDANSQSSKNGNPPIQRNAANARERARMRVLSSAFGRLKTKLPNIPPDTKLSKLDTLRLATMYIKQLKTLVEGGPCDVENDNFAFAREQRGFFNMQSGVQNLTWPFGFHHLQHADRQVPFNYSPMDWSQPQENYAKFSQACNDTYASDKNSNTNFWYHHEGSSDNANNSNNCLYENTSQQHVNQRNHQLHQPSLHHQKNEQTSIR